MGQSAIQTAWGIVVIGGLMALAWWLDQVGKMRSETFHRRGGKLQSFMEAIRLATERPAGLFIPPADFLGLMFGGIWLPIDFAWTGFAFLGEIGSGKTTLIVRYLQSVLALIRSRCGARLLLFDPKREFTPLVLSHLPRHIPVFLANPFDMRSSLWSIARDITSLARCDQLCHALVQQEKGESNNRFFNDAARAVLKAVILVLMTLAPERWSLRDVILICRTRRRLIWFLGLRRETKDVENQYLRARSGRDVVATLNAILDRYSTVAGCMDRASSSFSLRDFLDNDGVVILSLDDAVAEALKPIYSLMIRVLSDLILARNDPRRPTFVVLDEFSLFGKGDLIPLAIKGRSAGASIAIAAQDVLALEAIHGEKEARTLLGCMLSTGFLRATSDAMAKFSSGVIGEEEVDQYTISVAQGGNGTSITRNHAIVRRSLVMADEIKSLPLPDYKAGVVSGYFNLPGVGAYRADIRFRDGAPSPPTGPPIPEYLPRPAADQVLRPFTREDVQRLNLPSDARALAALGVPPLRPANPPQQNRVP